MKLCWLIPDDGGGGVVSVALSCVRQAQAAGHAATLLSLRPLCGWLEHDPCAGWTLDSLNQVPPDTDAIALLQRWLDIYPQDILVLNACGQADAAIPYLPAGPRLVYAVHDTAVRYWEAALRHERELDAVVAVSRVVAGCLRNRLQEPGKLRVIHNGSLFPPTPDLTAERPPDLLFLCGDNPTKGAHDLLRLWKRLVGDGFEGGLHWFGHMEASFERRVRRLPQAGRVYLRGRAPRAQVFATAARCRVFLMLSRVEPFGMVTVEAMSMGCVPVAWDIETGTREIVEPGESGIFAPLGDFRALAQAVSRVLVDHQTLGTAAAKRARERFGEERMWAEYAPCLAEVFARPAAIRPLAGQAAPPYKPPRRYFQLLPGPMRQAARDLAGAFPRLGYWLRDQRGR